MMDKREAHGSPFSSDVIQATKRALGLDPETSFLVDEELPSDVLETLVEQRNDFSAWEARFRASGERGAALIRQLETSGVPDREFDLNVPIYESGSKVATRKALQRLMDALSPHSPGLVAGSADLTDNTGVLLPERVAQTSSTPEGRQVYYGVREFAMGAAMVGMALHGGVRPVGSTFFVFSDYVRPAIRLAALSEAPCTFVFTHDSVAVGEDGPTHQPVEHLAALRAIPNLHVVRPSDANESVRLAQGLLSSQNRDTNALILTRQDIPTLGGEAAEASQRDAHRGGYVVRSGRNPMATIFATGSEVHVALEAADNLAAAEIDVRVVSLPCWTCFDEQPKSYRDEVVRRDLPSVSIEAGSTFGWAKFAENSLGIDTFGLSAPGEFVLDYFNMNAAAVEAAVRNAIGR
jgi:transketolase